MHVKAGTGDGALPQNHNETLVRVQKPTQGLKVKTNVKAGGNNQRIEQHVPLIEDNTNWLRQS